VVGVGRSARTTHRKGTTVNKKVPVVSVARAPEADELANLPLEASIALAEVADAMREGLLAFASATGLVVMH